MWNAAARQSGAEVTAENVSWNGEVAAGASVSFGFTGGWSGRNTAPAAFASGGETCTTGG
ncbi:hypothetical protein GCM10010271_41110 [Streptomyces kurssanovii]|nr:hypothetical protein GCM10010271_41110 [Streptomyces kurssanovii]